MIFTVQSQLSKTTATSRERYLLVPSSWDDFSHETSFTLFQSIRGDEPRRIGTVKIIEKDQRQNKKDGKSRPAIPPRFTKLGPRFISLGQDEDYYRRLVVDLGARDAERVLLALSDIAWQPDLAIPFETLSSFRNSLVRSNTAHRARRAGRAIVRGQRLHETAEFRYLAEIPRASAPLDLRINFDDQDKIPGRIACLIGRNAVGKTQVLASLARDLTALSRRSKKEIEKRDDRFFGKRPLFTRVIAVSYNAFDQFRRSMTRETGYVYCGLRNEKGVPSISHLTAEYERSLKRVIEGGRISIWKQSIIGVLDRRDGDFRKMLSAQADGSATPEEFLHRLSSGEAILTHLTTALVSWLEPFSLVLFDEPETHLHPNAVASLFNVLTKLLSRNDSYALIATHSPIVLQEIPRSRVLVLRREGTITECETLESESFGESLSELTRHVFETDVVANLYKTTLADLAEEEPLKVTLKRFQNQLSQNALSYLLAKHAIGGKG